VAGFIQSKGTTMPTIRKTADTSASVSMHQSPISYADLLYELREMEDCLKEGKAPDIYAAHMICKSLLGKLNQRTPYIRMPLA
jgi:hypothetical protein